jgi:hypothetical protein
VADVPVVLRQRRRRTESKVECCERQNHREIIDYHSVETIGIVMVRKAQTETWASRKEDSGNATKTCLPRKR